MRSSIALAVLLALAAAGPATAQVPTSTSAVVTSTQPGASSVRPEHARGLVSRETFEPEDYVLFLPRVLLSVPRWALAAVFWPLRQTLRLVEKYYVVEHVEDLLYNDARTAGIVPFIVGFPGAGLSGGARMFHEDLFGHQESVSVSASYGGLYQQAYGLRLAADNIGGGRLWFEGEAAYESKPNLYFFGLGGGPEQSGGQGLDPYAAAVETRFAEERYATRFRFGSRHGRQGSLLRTGVSVLYNHRRFDDGQRLRSGQLDLAEVYDTGLIPGFDDGADTLEINGELILDYRNHPGRPTSGFYVEAFAGGVPRQGRWRYFHWGVEASGYIELWAKERVLVLRGFVEAVEGSQEGVPFTELPRLGGPQRLRGYRLDSFRDEKAILGTVEYRWHLHQFVTASLFVDAGQVNDNYLDLVLTGDDTRWKLGFGGGLRIGSADRTLVNIDIAYGDRVQVFVSTEPLEAFASRISQL